jgi:hypothetical protein
MKEERYSLLSDIGWSSGWFTSNEPKKHGERRHLLILGLLNTFHKQGEVTKTGTDIGAEEPVVATSSVMATEAEEIETASDTMEEEEAALDDEAMAQILEKGLQEKLREITQECARTRALTLS